MHDGNHCCISHDTVSPTQDSRIVMCSSPGSGAVIRCTNGLSTVGSLCIVAKAGLTVQQLTCRLLRLSRLRIIGYSILYCPRQRCCPQPPVGSLAVISGAKCIATALSEGASITVCFWLLTIVGRRPSPQLWQRSCELVCDRFIRSETTIP